MASKQGTSNGPDWRDVWAFMEELERELGGLVTVTVQRSNVLGSQSIYLAAKWEAHEPVAVGVPLWASVSATFPGNGVRGFEAALLSLVYDLDKELYRRIEGMPPETA